MEHLDRRTRKKGVLMGQATVDLPDPGEMPAAPMSSADDLLSQMAGEEIDRLLAEADVEKPSSSSQEHPAQTPEADSETPITGAQIDELFQPAPTGEASVQISPATGAAENALPAIETPAAPDESTRSAASP